MSLFIWLATLSPYILFVIECCSGDLADLKVKSYDVEAWSPRQQKYFEVGSCSNLGDAQARRLRIRVKGENGNYLVKTLENGYSITKEGETTAMELVYDKELNTWNVVAEGVSTELLQMNGDGTAHMYLPNGEAMNVTLDAQGVAAARQATMINTYYAAR